MSKNKVKNYDFYNINEFLYTNIIFDEDILKISIPLIEDVIKQAIFYEDDSIYIKTIIKINDLKNKFKLKNDYNDLRINKRILVFNK